MMAPFDDPANIRNLLKRDSADIDWEAVRQRAESYPEEVRVAPPSLGIRRVGRSDRSRRAPSVLDIVLSKNPPIEALRTVIRANPLSLKMMFQYKKVPGTVDKSPLREACMHGDVSHEIIRAIIQEALRAIAENTIKPQQFATENIGPLRILHCRQ